MPTFNLFLKDWANPFAGRINGFLLIRREYEPRRCDTLGRLRVLEFAGNFESRYARGYASELWESNLLDSE
jgi:hypothetical protein